MKKNNLLLAFLVALIATMLVGCEEQKQQKKSPYLGGTQGIFATFEQFGILENGVATIFEDETFPIEVTLKNKGEEDVPAGAVILKIKGISPSDYEGIVFEKTNSNILEKASEFNPEGGEETVDFGDAKYKIPLAGSLYEATVFVTYKYPYKTHVAIPKVCFNRDLKDTTVCVIEEAKPVYSSGGPIQVKAAREKRAGAGIIALEFDVENVGGGDVTKPGQEFDTRYGQISFSIDETSEPSKWECRLGGEENGGRLINGKGTIRCKLKEPIAEEAPYVKEIDLTISYDYRDTIQQSIVIKKKG